MRRQLHLTLPTLMFALGAPLLLAGAIRQPTPGPEKVELADIPESVRKAIDTFSPGFAIASATREKAGDTSYLHVAGKADARAASLKVTAAGGRITEFELAVEPADLPPEFTAAITNRLPGARVSKAQRLESISYTATATDGRDTYEITMHPGGRLEARKSRPAPKPGT